MRCLVNQLALPERYLHRIAQKALRTVHVRVEADPDIAFAVVFGLMGSNGLVNFDQATKTKTIEKLLSQASITALHQIVVLFGGLIRQPGVAEEKAVDSRRQLLTDLLLGAVRSRKGEEVEKILTYGPISWIHKVLTLLVTFGFFTLNHDPDKPENDVKPPLSKASQGLFRSRISSCLVHLISTSQGANLPHFVVSLIRRLEEGHEDSQFLFQADDDVRQAVDRAWKILEKIDAKEKSTKDEKRASLRAFKLLYSLTILQVYNGDTDAVLVLDELKTCYGSLVKHHSADSAEASELLVDVLLSLISKPSALFRKIAGQAFTAFSAQINVAGLQAMIKV